MASDLASLLQGREITAEQVELARAFPDRIRTNLSGISHTFHGKAQDSMAACFASFAGQKVIVDTSRHGGGAAWLSPRLVGAMLEKVQALQVQYIQDAAGIITAGGVQFMSAGDARNPAYSWTLGSCAGVLDKLDALVAARTAAERLIRTGTQAQNTERVHNVISAYADFALAFESAAKGWERFVSVNPSSGIEAKVGMLNSSIGELASAPYGKQLECLLNLARSLRAVKRFLPERSSVSYQGWPAFKLPPLQFVQDFARGMHYELRG